LSLYLYSYLLFLYSYITTDGQPASLSWNKAFIWGLRPDLYYCLTVAGLLISGALSDERTGLSFTIAACPCQRSLSWVRVLWDSRPYFTVSDLRLPFSSPPTTRRVMVEVFDPASTLYLPLYNPTARTLRKTQSLYCSEGLFTDPLPSNGRPIVARV
jgi:hypothetical protein